MRIVAIASLLLILLLVSLSAYLRLEQSGIGCDPWPACYGNIGVENEAPDIGDAYERLLADATEPLAWARPLHRLVAGVLGLLILGLTVMALLQRRHRVASLSLLGLTVFLAWLGIYSEGLHSPAVVMGNLAGGFAMLAVCGWLVFSEMGKSTVGSANLRRWSTIAIVTLSLQILIGGLTSANFAASACATLPDCQGAWLPGAELWTAFDLSRSVTTTPEGFVVGGAERPAVHMLHRLFSLLTFGAVAAAGVLAFRVRNGIRPTGMLVCALIVLQMATGIAAVRFGIPIAVAVSHNWMAAVLMLGVLRLRAAA